MAVHRLVLMQVLVLAGVGIAVLLQVAIEPSSAAHHAQSSPCPGRGDGDLKTWGLSFEYVTSDKQRRETTDGTLPVQQTLVRPGDTIPIAIRADICTLSPVSRMAGTVIIAPDSRDLSYVTDSVSLDGTNVAHYELHDLGESSEHSLSFAAEDLAPISELYLSWTIKVSDCASVGSNLYIDSLLEFDAPAGDGYRRADGTVATRETIEMTEKRQLLFTVSPHPATEIANYTTRFHVSNLRPAPGWKEEYELHIANVGTTHQRRGVVLQFRPEELGPVFAGGPRTLERYTIDRYTGKRSVPREIKDTGDWYVDPPPGESVVISWTDTVATDTRIGTELQLVAGAGHDANQDGRALGSNEVAEAQVNLTVTDRQGAVYIIQHAASFLGTADLHPGTPVEVSIRLRNPTTELVKDLVLAVQHSFGLVIVPGSSSFRSDVHSIDATTPKVVSTHLADGWANGFRISRLQPNTEYRIDFLAKLNDDYLAPGDVVVVHASVLQGGELIAENKLALTLAGRGQLELSIEAVDTAFAGDVVRYVVKMANTGGGTLEEVALAADLPCGMSYVEAADWIWLSYAERLNGGAGYGVLAPDLSAYLGNPERAEPYRHDHSIGPGEMLEFSFNVRLDDELQPESQLKPVFHAIGRSGDGYQLVSSMQPLIVTAIVATAEQVKNTEASIVDTIKKPRFLAFEVLTAFLGVIAGGIVGAVVAYLKHDAIRRILGPLSKVCVELLHRMSHRR